MAESWLDTPRHAASVSVAYPQGRPLPIRARSMFVQLLLGGLAVWLAVTGLAAAGLLRSSADHTTKYVLVIDSGSSGTRIYAFNWTVAGQGSIPIIKPIPPAAAASLVPTKAKKGLYNRVETQPGLDAFVNDTQGLNNTALWPLLAWAKAVVPAGQHAATPLFLLGTGGLRRMEMHARGALLGDVRRILKTSGFRSHDPWAKVISGTDEGMYGWLALNYEQGMLQQHTGSSTELKPVRNRHVGVSGSSVSVSLRPLGVPTSLGALDLGGASLEMTFEVLPASNHSSEVPAASDSSLQNVTVANKTFHLHTHTFQHYGLNEAYDRAVTLLLAKQQEEHKKQQEEHQQQQQNDQESPVQLLPSGLPDKHPAVSAAEKQPQGAEHRQPGLSSLPVSSAAVAEDTSVTVSPGLSADAVLAQHHATVDLAMAAAAGVMPKASAAAAAGSRATSGSPAVLAEHKLQELAVAAAAGLRPTVPVAVSVGSPAADASATPQGPSANGRSSQVMQQYNVQADLSVAVAAGLHPQHQQHMGSRRNATKDVSSSVLPGSASSVQPASSPVAAAIVGSQQASSDSGATASTGDQMNEQSPAAGTAAAARRLLGQNIHRLGHHATYKERRQQLRRQRQLLMQQHRLSGVADIIQAWGPKAYMQTINRRSSSCRDAGCGSADRVRTRHVKEQHMPAASMQLRRLLNDGAGRQASTGSQQVQDFSSGGGAASTGAPVASVSKGHSLDLPTSSTDSRAAMGSSGSTTGSASSAVIADQPATSQHASSDTASMAAAIKWPEVLHPCLHDGYAAKYERLVFKGMVPNPPQVLLRGRFDWSACLALVDQIVNASAPCQVSPARPSCRLGSAQPTLQGNFIALTGFYVVSKFLEVPPDAPLGTVLDASKDLCARPWSWVSEQLGHNINAERYCTWGPYAVKLLRHGLGLKDTDVRIGSGDLGWPLGAALAEASKLPDMLSRRQSAYQPLWSMRASTSDALSTAAHGDNEMHKQGVQAPNLGEWDSSNKESHAGVWQYSQRRSWAQVMLGSKGHKSIAQSAAIFLCVVVWLSLWACCVPNKGRAVSGGMMLIPALKSVYGPGKAQNILPVAAYPVHIARRNNPSPCRPSSGLKYVP